MKRIVPTVTRYPAPPSPSPQPDVRPLDSARRGQNLVSGVQQIRSDKADSPRPGSEGIMLRLSGQTPELITFAMITSLAKPIGTEVIYPYPWPVGIIEFGVGNANLSRIEFDLNRFQAGSSSGTLITLPGSQFTVKMRDDGAMVPAGMVHPLVTRAMLGTPSGYTGQVMAAYGSRGASQRLTRTIVIVTDAGTVPGNTSVKVPAFAKAASVIRNSAVQFDYLLTFPGPNGPLDGPYTVAAGVPSPEFPLPGGASEVSISWAAAVDWLAVVFYLDI